MHASRNPGRILGRVCLSRGFLVESDVLNGATKLFDTSGLEVEFLIGKRGAGIEPALRTNVGVTAQAILGIWPFLDEEKLGAVLAKLTKKERARAREFMEEHGLMC